MNLGVNQANISMGDPTGNFPKYLWNCLHPEFPNVIYFDNYGQKGRSRVQLSTVPFYWSVTNRVTAGQPVVQDYTPVPFAQADYLINLAVPKSHALGGITAFAKNFYGALLRCPDGYFRDAGAKVNYSDMHKALPANTPNMGRYRTLVDLMGHPSLGGKTLLCLGDMLFSVVNLGRFLGMDPEAALETTVAKFVRRFDHVERRLRERGQTLEEATLAEMDALWEEAKRRVLTLPPGAAPPSP